MDLVLTHITDIHIKQEEDIDILMNRTHSIAGAISEVIRNPEKTMLILCVTGDISYSGSEEQYDIAGLFFDDLFDKLKKRFDKLDIHFAFVPGNHDCNFEGQQNIVRDTVIKSAEINTEDAGTIELCTSIQKNYFDFVDRYVAKNMAVINRRNSIFTQHTLNNEQLGDYNIKIHCLNTAWCSTKSEKKELLFSVPTEIEPKQGNDIVITLMHHGSNWFNWEGAERWNAYHREFSDIIMVGHDHYSDYVHQRNYDSSSNYFIRGNQLYSSEETEKSGFNIIKINLEDNIEFFYTYSWDGGVYKRIIDSKAQPFERNKFLKSSMKLTQSLMEYIEDIGIDISSKYKPRLRLSDIYVFPALKGDSLDSPNKTKVYRGQKSILEIIQHKKKILINGYKEYGKTSLVKRLFFLFYEKGFYPVLLNVDDIRSSSEDLMNDLIRETYKKSYDNINIDEIMQMEKEKRICFIDNFDENILRDKSQTEFLEYLNNQFDIVILTTNSNNNMIDKLKRFETNGYINDQFYRLEIGSLRRVGKSRIVDNWLLLEDPEQDVNSQEFDTKRKVKLSEMQSVLRNGYFNDTPLEFLLVLSYLDNSEIINTDYSRHSYIYDFLIREKINEISNNDTNLALAYNTLLEILAYDLYKNNEPMLFEEKFLLKAIADYNENYPPMKKTSTGIIQKLVEHKILEERNNKFKFKYNYMYYSFVGSYITGQLSAEEKTKKIIEVFSDLSVQTNYNIALFIAYSMNTEFDVLPKLQTICACLLSEYKEFKYEDQRSLLDKINEDVLEKLNELYKIPENSEIPKMQEAMRIEQDDFDEEHKKELPEEKKEHLDESFLEFSKLLRVIQFQGDILKNYGSKIKNKPRTEIIELMGSSNLKLIGFLCNSLSYEVDRIIEYVEKKAKENEEDVLEKELVLTEIKDFISIMWAEFIELNISNLAYCYDCDLIQNDILAYRETAASEFIDVVSIEYMLRVSKGKLPVSEIEKCLSGKRKLSAFTMNIMKYIVASYLSIYQYDSKDKERVCSLLNFDYHKLFIEEKKVAALGLDR